MIITKEEERMAFVYSLASKHVTLSFLFDSCVNVVLLRAVALCLYGAMEILRITHQTWENKALSAVLIFMVTARQLHKDKPP